jgi:hypothetical protein
MSDRTVSLKRNPRCPPRFGKSMVSEGISKFSLAWCGTVRGSPYCGNSAALENRAGSVASGTDHRLAEIVGLDVRDVYVPASKGRSSGLDELPLVLRRMAKTLRCQGMYQESAGRPPSIRDPPAPRRNMSGQIPALSIEGAVQCSGWLYGPVTLTSTAVSGVPVKACSSTIPIPGA